MKLFLPLIILFTSILFSKHPQSIQGKWINNIDSKSILLITKSKYIEIYGGSDVSCLHYHLDNYSCDTAYLSNKVKGVAFLKVDDGRCFEILGLTKHTLSLRYTISGKLLVFHK